MNARASLLACVALAALLGCRSSEQEHEPSPALDSSTRVLVLPTDDPRLPAGPGQVAFLTSCLVCHSSRYVSDQPRFPRKVWAAEVEKMTKTYGASIAPDQAAQIVDYLVAIHGAE